jgi:hypothetical protein
MRGGCVPLLTPHRRYWRPCGDWPRRTTTRSPPRTTRPPTCSRLRSHRCVRPAVDVCARWGLTAAICRSGRARVLGRHAARAAHAAGAHVRPHRRLQHGTAVRAIRHTAGPDLGWRAANGGVAGGGQDATGRQYAQHPQRAQAHSARAAAPDPGNADVVSHMGARFVCSLHARNVCFVLMAVCVQRRLHSALHRWVWA